MHRNISKANVRLNKVTSGKRRRRDDLKIGAGKERAALVGSL